MTRRAAACLALLALAACDRTPVPFDIDEVGPARFAALPQAPGGPDRVPLDVVVKAGPLRAVLDRRGAFDLAIVDCAAPDAPAEPLPLYFGGEPVTGLRGGQLDDDPDMNVLLSAAAPRAAVEQPRPCARFVTRASLFGPEIVSRPVPFRAGP